MPGFRAGKTAEAAPPGRGFKFLFCRLTHPNRLVTGLQGPAFSYPVKGGRTLAGPNNYE